MPHSPRPIADYHARLQRVSDHIHDHLAEPLNLTQLAELGCLSPCHWHRIYASFFGETMAATVKRLRLQKAAGDLALTTLPVRQVATRCGYPNVQSFTRTFSQAYGLPPLQYRARGPHVQFTQHVQFKYASPGYQDGAFTVQLMPWAFPIRARTWRLADVLPPFSVAWPQGASAQTACGALAFIWMTLSRCQKMPCTRWPAWHPLIPRA